MRNETTAAGKVVVITGASSGPVACRRASTRARSRRACGRHRPNGSNGCSASWNSSKRSSAQVATDFRRLVDALARAGVEFVIVGGVAVVAHGHRRAALLQRRRSQSRRSGQRRLPRIKRQELFESQHESGRDVQDIQAPCTECLGMQGTQALGFGHDRRERG